MTRKLLSLTLKGTDVSEKTFVTMLAGCRKLRHLDVSCCNSLFMTGALLSKDEDRERLAGVLDNVEEVNLSSLRYISDACFNRIMSLCPNIQKVHLNSNQIHFHSDIFYELDTPGRPFGNTSVLTFANLMAFMQIRSSQMHTLSLSRTSIHDEGLKRLVAVPGLSLKELNLVACRDISDDGVTELAKKQTALQVLDLSQCADVTDLSIGDVCQSISGLKRLVLNKCRRVTDMSAAKIRHLSELEHLDVSSCYTITSKGLILGLCKPNMRNIQELILNCLSCVNDTFIVELCACIPKLSILDVSSCGITDRSIHYISKYLCSLRVLRLAWCKDISDNGLMGIIANSTEPATDALAECDYKLHVRLHAKEKWLPISNIRTLQSLDLTSCHRVTDASITKVMTLPELRTIHLSMCPGVTDEGLRAIADNIPGLEELYLTQCTSISDAGVTYLSQRLYRMRTLDVSNCNLITNKSLEALFNNCKRIHHLDVSLCNVTYEMVEMLENNLPHLHTVNKRLVGSTCPLHDVCSQTKNN
ncbi:hypothetical protein CAPTEDRAFT_129421 [Capitella teleta]|uniref:F-box/LRR-repeat protein 15-like leucin rich repeat domain-containing protein n=1 Tax=Capitella teleta TaxID=283909 RepID=R7U836_CAPTE|nr:hypothetical protein CAPTEDRAFT_129421 [Capitella teleta]|eukprot:ELU02530.1 hypothetical protein CAPTEDRAFT_129421 [Capitella teleta]